MRDYVILTDSGTDLSPEKAITWLEENMMPYYPLGVYKDKTQEGEKGNE